MAMSPYGMQGSQPMEEQKDFSLVSEYFKFKYLAWPGTYSPTKGIATPFGFAPNARSISRLTSKIAIDARRAGFAAWETGASEAAVKAAQLKGGARSFFGNFKEAWSGGKAQGRVLGYESYTRKLDQANRSVSAASAPLKDAWKTRRAARVDPTRSINALKKVSARTGGYATTRGGATIPGDPKTWVEAESKILQLRSKMTKIDSSTVKSIATLRGKKGAVTRLLTQKSARQAGKLAITGAKAVSWIGLGLMIGEVALAVGQPIGRAIMDQVNSTFERMENRFMPELGGRLNAAYLSYGAATERQRAVQAISKSHLNGRSAYGQEAALTHS
jgi:hypothetical protein